MDNQIIDFTVDPAILHSIIKSQAGTLGKAIIEGVMNSIDASAKSLSITLTQEGFVLSDDGRGFRNKHEIDQWFTRFGTEHQKGDATFGRFRMGRGQMMAFAVTTWRTGKFEMKVDIAKAMGFAFQDGLSKVKGCHIVGELYSKLSEWDLESTIAEVKELAMYAQIPVELNGVLISKNPKKVKWDLTTDDAYIQIDREEGKPLKVYNLGVLVREYWSSEFGCGGTVVTKTPVDVNFARNDILWSCEVWQRIKDFVRKANIDKVARNRKLNTGERAFLAKQFIFKRMVSTEVDPLDMKLITDVTGRHFSIRDLLSVPRISHATEKQGRAAEKLHRMGAAFVLNSETLTRFGVETAAELMEKLKSVSGLEFPEVQLFEKVSEGFSEDYKVLAEEELTPEEILAFRTVLEFHGKYHAWFASNDKTSGVRKLLVGESNVAGAWTDGETYIVIGLGTIRKVVKRGAFGFMDLLSLLTHEYVHDSADLESHDHGLNFYNRYHDLMEYGGTGKLMSLSLEMEKAYNKALVKAKLVSTPAQKVSKTPAVRAVQKRAVAQNQESYSQVPQQASFAM